jgi:hypothetical protein
MKKNSSMAELLSHHHLALTLTTRIRKGIENGVDKKRISAYTLHFYRHFLKDQFDREEAIYSCLSDSNMLRIQACSEHALLSPLFERMNQVEFSQKDLERLATILEKHIRFETDNVFPHVESLNFIPHRYTTADYREHWADQFWTGYSN